LIPGFETKHSGAALATRNRESLRPQPVDRREDLLEQEAWLIATAPNKNEK
jgi:hypothetical protein